MPLRGIRPKVLGLGGIRPVDDSHRYTTGATATNATAGDVVGTGTAYTVSANVQPNAGLASGTGSAFDATVSTAIFTDANAGVAAGSGSAYTASASIAPSAGLASGTGVAYDATVSAIAATLPTFRVWMSG